MMTVTEFKIPGLMSNLSGSDERVERAFVVAQATRLVPSGDSPDGMRATVRASGKVVSTVALRSSGRRVAAWSGRSRLRLLFSNVFVTLDF